MDFDWNILSRFGTEVILIALMLWYMRHRDSQTRELADNGHRAVEHLASSFAELNTTLKVQNELLRQKSEKQ